MNPQNPDKSFRLTPGIIPWVIGINLLSLNSLITLTPQAAFSQSNSLIPLTLLNKSSDHTKHNPDQNTRLFAQNGLIQVPEDRRFINQDFSQRLFWYIPWWNDACGYYSLNPYCAYQRKHLFKDVTLITEADSTAYARATLEFKQPVSLSQALSYAQIISRGDMRLNSPTSRSDEKIVYDETDPEFNAGSVAEFQLTQNQNVSKIIYTIVTP